MSAPSGVSLSSASGSVSVVAPAAGQTIQLSAPGEGSNVTVNGVTFSPNDTTLGISGATDLLSLGLGGMTLRGAVTHVTGLLIADSMDFRNVTSFSSLLLR